MLAYNEIRERKYIILDGEPYEVLDAHVFRKQQRKPVNQTKLRNLINGGTKQHTFHNNDNVEEADLERNKVVFSFKKENKQTGEIEYWFHEEGNRANRFSIGKSVIGDQYKYMKENSSIDALYFNEQVIGISLPIKVELRVVEAPPSIKGNTASGADKLVTVETGAQVTVPIFIKEGDVIIVKTETGEYTERAK